MNRYYLYGMNQDQFDVIIIGGSYAGLSSALLLGRSLRRVLVLDSGKPCNRQTPHAHGFLTRDGETPARLAAIAREQVLAYPTVSLLNDTAVRAYRQADGFRVETQSGAQFSARKLVLATGVEDLMPDLPGFAECWGRSVLHCPYCHGYEVHGQPLGVLGNGDVGYEMATLIQHWSRDLTLFTNGPATLTESQRHVLDRLNVRVVEPEIASITHQDGFLTAIQFADGRSVPLTALFARVPFRQRHDLAGQLGCELTESGLITVTEFGETNVPGVCAVGDVSSQMRQLSMAVASGVKAAAWLNRELIAEDIKNRVGELTVTESEKA